jgi:replicative DNA helicase
MPGYQQVMRSASKDVSKQLAELLSVDMSLSDSDFSNYAMKVRKYEHYPIYFNNVPRTMEYIINANEKITEESPESIIVNVYDHSRLIRGSEDSELKKLNTISKGCMLLQSQFNVVNILLSQLNRNIEQEHRARNQYQPLLTDLFGGDSIGQDAHVVMILNRPNDLYGITEKYCDEDPVGLMAVHIEKNRDGMLGMIAYEADMSTFNITERK